MTELKNNRHLAANLRRKLERAHPEGSALRERLKDFSDDQLVALYLAHEQQGREHAAKRSEQAEELEAPAYLRTAADSQRQS